MNNLLQKLVAWGSVALNWIKRFFKYVWNLIKSLWPKIKELAKEWLLNYSEVIFLDGREQSGRSLIEALKESRPDEIIEDINGLVSIAVNKDGTIGKIGDIIASPEIEDNFDKMSQSNGGILRING